MTTMRDAALGYAAQGWAVFPIWWVDQETGRCACGKTEEEGCSPGKHPIGTVVPQGFKNATTEAAKIEAWWARYPLANIGAATGEASGFDALDIDTRHDGFDNWQALRSEHGELSETIPTTFTPSGGRHYYFRHAKNLTNRRGALPRGIDVRGDGGYVVLPPSVALGADGTGRPYRWVVEPTGDVLENWPMWILRIIVSEPESAANGSGSTEQQQRQYNTPYNLGGRIQHGARNTTLISLAGTDRRRGLPEDVIRARLLEANERMCEPPLPEAEVHRIVQSVMNYAPPDPDQFPRTDVGNARRLALQYATDMKYCHIWQKWMLWTGSHWIKDESEEIMRRARQSIDELHVEAMAIDNVDERNAQRDYALRCQTDAKLAATVRQCRSLPEIVVSHEIFNQQPWLLTVRNGTIDLRTGELLPHDPDHYMMQMIDIDYIPNAPAPLWRKTISEVFVHNQELAEYVQRSLGYAMTGDTSEDKFFIWWGAGSNGKSTIQDTLLSILRPYASTAESNLLLDRHGEPHPTGMADLFGKRAVFASETGKNKTFNEAIVKQLTGGDVIKARKMREDFWEFRPTQKVFLVTNHRPDIKDMGHGFWRRVVLVPWLALFPKTEEGKHLGDKLLLEKEGILAWLVEGCMMWQEHGLYEPQIILDAIEAYRREQDVLGAWLASACEEGTVYEESLSALHLAYREWLSDGGWRNAPTIQKFGVDLTERGYSRKEDQNYMRTGLRLKRADLRLLRDEEPDEPEMKQGRLY